ncbi:MAG: glutathione peroxidase [Arenicella sp.]|jgi:glutathione peroxidase|nr:glutathione peroxidase [Arenicella sp.]
MKNAIANLTLLSAFLFVGISAAHACDTLLDFSAQKLRSKDTVNFCEEFSGKPLLVVNTASKCGFTPQFEELEELNKRYAGKLNIVGFPSDDFKQEHADEEAIGKVCFINYGVTFTMLEPSSVRGDNANTLFKNLAEVSGEQPGWNFTKYLIAANGQDVTHFESNVKPLSSTVVGAVDAALE